MGADGKIPISTMRQMEQALGQAVARLAADAQLMQLAALNPIFAMEEAGFEFGDELRASIERRVRFQPAPYARMGSLAGEIARHAGRPVDPPSADALDRLLFSELKLVRPTSTLQAQVGAKYQALLSFALPTERLLPQL